MKRRLRSALCLLLCLLALTPAARAASAFKPKNALEGKRQALELLAVSGFQSEYGKGEAGQNLTRWQKPIRIWVGGTPTGKDLNELDSFLMQLSFRVPGLPAISRVKTEEEANIRIYFVKYQNMPRYVQNFQSGSWGFFSYYENKGVIYKADIAIARDKASQNARYHILKEELTGALGLPNDHLVYTDSILYQKYTVTRQLSEVDWLMLNMLYSPVTRPGMTWSEAEDALINWMGL